MPAGVQLYKLRLYRGMFIKVEADEYLDPSKDDRLRELLIEKVKAAMRTDRVRLDQGWKLWVLGPKGHPIYAKVSVDGAGQTVIER